MPAIVYKTTNTVTGKFYIGVHRQADVCPYEFDGYLGSGTLLKKAIKKYGKQSFVRDTLFVFDSIEEAFNKEKSLLSYVLNTKDCYNIDSGGVGNAKDNLAKKSDAYLKEMRTKTGRQMGLSNKGRKHSPDINKKKAQPGNKHKLGVVESAETREKKRLAKLGKPSNAVGNYQPVCSCIVCGKQLTSSTIKRHTNFHHNKG
jgi:hypothetical protein